VFQDFDGGKSYIIQRKNMSKRVRHDVEEEDEEPNSVLDTNEAEEQDFKALRDYLRTGPAFFDIVDKFPRLFMKYYRGVESAKEVLRHHIHLQDACDPLDLNNLQSWMIKMFDVIKGPISERKIYFIVDPVGCNGKSSFATHLLMKYKAFLIAGRIDDVSLFYNYESIVVFDLYRNEQPDYVLMQRFKDGRAYNSKNGFSFFPAPHVIVLMNEMPDMNALSKDRFEITYLPQ
jgi:hypothetical protein